MGWNILQSKDDNDRYGIVKLQKISFPGEAEQKYETSNWEWQYKENSFGESEIFIVKDNDKIVGHYAFIPQEYLIYGETVTAGYAVNAMVHPDYRKKGMYNSIQEYAVTHTQKTFSIGGTIRKPIMRAEIRGGYQITKKIPIFVLPLNFTKLLGNVISLPIVAAIIGYPLTKLYRLLFPNKIKNGEFLIEKVDALGNAIGGFFDNQIDVYDIHFKKNIPYVRWRFDEIRGVKYDKFIVRNNKNNHDVIAYFVLRGEKIKREKNFNNCLNIIDLEMIERREELLSHIIKFIVSLAREHGYDSLTFYLLDDGFISKQMKYHGMFKYPFDYYSLMVRNNKDKDIATLFKQSKKVYLNFSDTDIL